MLQNGPDPAKLLQIKVTACYFSNFIEAIGMKDTLLISCQAWFKRRILHAPNQILILVDWNEYIRLILFKRRITLPNKIAEREQRVLNSHWSKHKLFT